jgi:hypothetical protein
VTVGEFIEKLKAFDPSMAVMIDDADTRWSLDISNVYQDDEGVFVYGGYYADTPMEPRR